MSSAPSPALTIAVSVLIFSVIKFLVRLAVDRNNKKPGLDPAIEVPGFLLGILLEESAQLHGFTLGGRRLAAQGQ